MLLNVLDQKIVPVKTRREAGGLVDFEEPLGLGDEIEIVIKHRFKYIREHTFTGVGGREVKKAVETEMIFAKITRNLTRPRLNHFFQ